MRPRHFSFKEKRGILIHVISDVNESADSRLGRRQNGKVLFLFPSRGANTRVEYPGPLGGKMYERSEYILTGVCSSVNTAFIVNRNVTFIAFKL